MTTTLDPDLADQIGLPGTFAATACTNCGVCTAVCPAGLDLLPRRLMHLVLLGAADRLRAETETIYSCLLCGLCEEQCPAGVRITDTMRALRHYCNRTTFGL
ncbi:MAG: 4Fe-4S dicluster domain-containing protein [Dactylosporangium sp.]|nr:4Fe-4S dicluster domain-containing protein [Dactylosporangium sp.]NNJ62059.1 4Fe-4S dicluster domain-containing protein [Dactylosporangium sp.]